MDLPILLLGLEGWLETLLSNPGVAGALLDRCEEFSASYAHALLAEGADLIISPATSANPRMVPVDRIEALTLPALARSLSRIEGPVFLHSAGIELSPALERLGAATCAAGYVLGPRESPASARDALGPGPVIVGSLDGPALADRDEAGLEAECLELLAASRGDPRFILGSSAADIPIETPLATLRVPLRAASEAHGLRWPA